MLKVWLETKNDLISGLRNYNTKSRLHDYSITIVLFLRYKSC